MVSAIAAVGDANLSAALGVNTTRLEPPTTVVESRVESFLVQETTLVRWLPMLESRPSAEMVDEQAAVKFSPLAELMTAEGPPFT